jgi:hypothetical protein
LKKENHPQTKRQLGHPTSKKEVDLRIYGTQQGTKKNEVETSG